MSKRKTKRRVDLMCHTHYFHPMPSCKINVNWMDGSSVLVCLSVIIQCCLSICAVDDDVDHAGARRCSSGIGWTFTFWPFACSWNNWNLSDTDIIQAFSFPNAKWKKPVCGTC